jgi:hypothetical protein
MSAEQTNRDRREYADLVEERRRLEHDVAMRTGTLASPGERGKRLVEGLVTGVLLAELWSALRS